MTPAARTYPHVYAAVGWHPENCAPYTEDSLDALRAWAREPKVVAIGEIGLDYYWEQNPPSGHSSATSTVLRAFL